MRAVAGRPVMATPVMTEAETMAMTGPMGQAPTAMTRPIPAAATGPRGPQPPERKTSSWVMAVLAALGVLAVVALGIGLYLANNNSDDKTEPPATVAVPKVTGLSEDAARTKLQQAGFQKIETGTPKVTSDCDSKVESQQPAPNTPLAVDQPVTIVMCQSPEKVQVPTGLVGNLQSAAEQALEGKGLVPVIDRVDNDAREGQVLFVEDEGKQVEPGTKITVRVSRGNLFEIPDVKGQSLEAARAVLENRGFTNIEVEEVPQDGEPGTVVEQTPDAKQKRSKSTQITLTVVAEQEPAPDDTSTPDPDDSTPPDGDGDGTGAGDGDGTGVGGIFGN